MIPNGHIPGGAYVAITRLLQATTIPIEPRSEPSVIPAARPDLDTRAEALFAQARKRHDDEIRKDEREKIAQQATEMAARELITSNTRRLRELMEQMDMNDPDVGLASAKFGFALGLRALARELRGKP